MTNKRKWHKEIKAWANGAEIEVRHLDAENKNWHDWKSIDHHSYHAYAFKDEYEYRIKAQPKEPQYLYVYRLNGYSLRISQEKDSNDTYKGDFLGKIKLEQDDDTE